jgi:hypothetical protein
VLKRGTLRAEGAIGVREVTNFTHVTDRGGVFAQAEVNGGKSSVGKSFDLTNCRAAIHCRETRAGIWRAIAHTTSFTLYYDEIHAGGYLFYMYSHETSNSSKPA